MQRPRSDQHRPRRRQLLTAGLALAGLRPARAAAWPDKPVRLVIPFGAGGSVDVVGRMLAEKMGPQMGQTLIIDNRPGGATTIGAQAVARSAPDGTTLFYGTPATQIINPTLMPNLPYDPDKDLLPTGSVMRAPNLLLVHPSLGVSDIPGLIALAKARPGELVFATGIRLQHVPFRTFGAYSSELLAGRVQMCFGTISDMLALSADGALVRVAVTGARRSPLLPNVPTVAETLPGYEATAYNYIAVPAGTPRPLVLAINAAFNRALSDPEIVARMTATGLEPLGADTPEQAADTILAERRRWRGVIESAGIRLEG